MYYVLFVIFLLAAIGILLFHFRKRKIIRKVDNMCQEEKLILLDELIHPLGYCYNEYQDIFATTTDAWQKQFGYTSFYDQMAPFFNMVFDCKPIYFDYDGKTWLIELWKGQYGINTGAEVGVYRADRILSPEERDTALFSAVGEENYLDIRMELFDGNRHLADRQGYHWWLTAFLMGKFSKPQNLTMDVRIRFPDYQMCDAFLHSLHKSNLDTLSLHVQICGTDACLSFSGGNHRPLLRRIHCRFVLWKNKQFCRLYCFVTRPFSLACDKLLYLYYYLPFAFRRVLRLKSERKIRRYKKQVLQFRQSRIHRQYQRGR